MTYDAKAFHFLCSQTPQFLFISSLIQQTSHIATMATAGYAIHVAGLAPETTEEKLHDFFSFCGKLVSVKKDGSKADITFEKLSAMRTSLMLNGGTVSILFMI